MKIAICVDLVPFSHKTHDSQREPSTEMAAAETSRSAGAAPSPSKAPPPHPYPTASSSSCPFPTVPRICFSRGMSGRGRRVAADGALETARSRLTASLPFVACEDEGGGEGGDNEGGGCRERSERFAREEGDDEEEGEEREGKGGGVGREVQREREQQPRQMQLLFPNGHHYRPEEWTVEALMRRLNGQKVRNVFRSKTRRFLYFREQKRMVDDDDDDEKHNGGDDNDKVDDNDDAAAAFDAAATFDDDANDIDEMERGKGCSAASLADPVIYWCVCVYLCDVPASLQGNGEGYG